MCTSTEGWEGGTRAKKVTLENTHVETQEERGVEVVSISEMKTDVFRSIVIKTETKAEP